MDALDKVIGYDGLKKEIRKIVDIMKNPNKYESLGVNLPHGIMFFGPPGVGKSLMADCLIELSGWNSYVCRKDKPNGEFVNHIRETFQKAMRNEPSIILLDDLDKFSSDDRFNNNSEEYVAVQACMDQAKDRKVVVVATVNEKYYLPESLRREGRFDEKFEIKNPRGKDAEQIIKFYLGQKKYVSTLNIDEISRLLNGFSCAELESLINKAGVNAGYNNRQQIEMDDILKAYIKTCYKAPACTSSKTKNQLEAVAYHEAGHAVVSELLQPGSVSLVTIANHMGDIDGFTAYYESDDYWIDKSYMDNRIITLLAGRAVTELKFGKIDTGANSDIERAFRIARRIQSDYCECGFRNYYQRDNIPENIHMLITHELDKYYLKSKDLIANHMDIVDKLANKLMEKELLSQVEIAEIMKNK